MFKRIKLLAFSFIIISLFVILAGCKTVDISEKYDKEDAGGTGYGAPPKSELYIEDFYFLTVGTEKSKIELLNGNAHYYRDNNDLLPVYTLNNGDSISLKYDEKNSTTLSAVYTYNETNLSENFFEILVDLEILKTPNQETGNPDTIIPGTDVETTTPPNKDDTSNNNDLPNNDSPSINPPSTQKPTQGTHFATGMYNYGVIKPILTADLPRDTVLSTVGKPNYFYSHSFSSNSYIIDCYNLNDGSKLYLDYGFERLRLRAAALYKNGTYTSILGTPWSAQVMPEGYTRNTVARIKFNRLTKNLTPSKVYSILGEPAWYEGTRGNYNDVYVLPDGAKAVLNFGTAHNKLSSISIKEKDGSITVMEIK